MQASTTSARPPATTGHASTASALSRARAQPIRLHTAGTSRALNRARRATGTSTTTTSIPAATPGVLDPGARTSWTPQATPARVRGS
ncbi:hypothetical protein [Ornithinimicrobium kibberense]|uniref:hypothetical protein n=1 Tax=Ornithinimicrobium kibberense TaxID=282060 RepID=UPI003613C2E5